MKKIIAICMAVIVMLSLSVFAFAEFVSSPSKNKAPELISATDRNGCDGVQLIITAYGDRDELPEETQEILEEAYDQIKNAYDLSALNSKIKEICKDKGVDIMNIAVSDLFDISAMADCTHDNHHFDIVLKSDLLENFVCLLHYYNGEWRIVENAEVTHSGEHLEFDEKEFSPFAIVIDTDKGEGPGTGDNSNNIAIYVVAMAVVAVAMVVILKKSKKAEA